MFEKSKNYISIFEDDVKINQIKNEVENFLLTGPLLFGWILGILRYPASSRPFLVSFQSGIVSFTFLALYGTGYTLYIFFDIPSDTILNLYFSILSGTYLLISLISFYLYRKGENIPGMRFTQSFLDRLIRTEKESIS